MIQHGIVEVRKAERKKAKLRLGIAAPSGAGKTLGSLLIAFGMLREKYPAHRPDQIWDLIGINDSEEGSGELYVGVEKYGLKIGQYAYSRMHAPYTPRKYIDHQLALEAAGVEVVIHDSLTHAWAGSGGLLEKQGKLTDADRYKNSYAAWRHVTPEHTALVDALLQSPSHIICTMRSKVEYAMQAGANGRQQITKLGMAPVQREGMEYEFTLFLDVSDQSVAHATKDRTDLFASVNAANVLEKKEFIITPAVGADLMRWLNTGADAQQQAAHQPVQTATDAMPDPIAIAQTLAADISSAPSRQALNAIHASNPGFLGWLAVNMPDWHNYVMTCFNTRWQQLPA